MNHEHRSARLALPHDLLTAAVQVLRRARGELVALFGCQRREERDGARMRLTLSIRSDARSGSSGRGISICIGNGSRSRAASASSRSPTAPGRAPRRRGRSRPPRNGRGRPRRTIRISSGRSSPTASAGPTTPRRLRRRFHRHTDHRRGFPGGYTGLVVTRASSSCRVVLVHGFRKGEPSSRAALRPAVTCSLRAPRANLEDACGGRHLRLEVHGSVVSDNGVFGAPDRPGVLPRHHRPAPGLLVDRNMLTGLFVWCAGRREGAASGGTSSTAWSTGSTRRSREDGPHPPGRRDDEGCAVRGSSPSRRAARGGIVTQGADLVFSGNAVTGNSAWGMSLCRTPTSA